MKTFILLATIAIASAKPFQCGYGCTEPTREGKCYCDTWETGNSFCDATEKNCHSCKTKKYGHGTWCWGGQEKAKAAPDLSFLTTFPSDGAPEPPISKKCMSAMEKLYSNAAVNATQAKVHKDMTGIANKIGSMCGKDLSPCKGADGATKCCTEDAFADGLWKSGMADLKQWQAAAQKVDSSASLCMYNLDYVQGPSSATGSIMSFSFENYVPQLWVKDACSAADGAAFLKWQGEQCYANGKAHGALGCTFSYSDDHCPGHHLAEKAPKKVEVPKLDFVLPQNFRGGPPPLSPACAAAGAKLNASSAVRAAAMKVSKDLTPIATSIGNACGKALAPCDGPDGATKCCKEDAIANGMWTASDIADLKAEDAAIKSVVSDAYVCMMGMSFVAGTGSSTFNMVFDNYIPTQWSKTECTATDKAAYLKWASGMCMSMNKAHGFKACTYHFSPDNCPFSG